MARTLPTALIAEEARIVTRPRFLVELGFTPALRFSTRGLVRWNSLEWRSSTRHVSIGELEWDGTSFQQLEITVGNTDREFGKLVALQNARGKPVRVWDAGGVNPFPALNDVQAFFEGVIQDAEIAEDVVTLRAINQPMDQMYTPREFWSAAFGWSQVATARGRVLEFGETKFRLDAQD